MDFNSIKFHNREPVYIQIVEYVKQAILIGDAVDGEVLPSRREMGVILNLNPNTVQKAYKLMEAEGLIVTPPNAASRLVLSKKVEKNIEQEMKDELIGTFVSAMKGTHLSLEETCDLVKEYWNGVK